MPIKGTEAAKPRGPELAEGGSNQDGVQNEDQQQLKDMVRQQKTNVVELQKRIRRRVKNEGEIRNQAKLIAEAQKSIAPFLREGDRAMTLEMLETDILDTFGAAVNVVSTINVEIRNVRDLLSDIPTMAERGVAAGTRSWQNQLDRNPTHGVQRTSTMVSRGRGRGRGRGRLSYSPPLIGVEEENVEMFTPRSTVSPETENANEEPENSREDNLDWLASSGVLTFAENPVLKLVEEQNRSRPRRTQEKQSGSETGARSRKKRNRTTQSTIRTRTIENDRFSCVEDGENESLDK